MFEDPYRYCDENRAKTEIFTDANRREARAISAESFVLLKNQGNVLPLKKSGTIALIGPLADAKENMAGTWSVSTKQEKSISLLAGINAAVGKFAKVLYAVSAASFLPAIGPRGVPSDLARQDSRITVNRHGWRPRNHRPRW